MRSGRDLLGTVIVIAKEPVAGRVKTRLCPPFSLAQAADLARAALADTLAATSAVPARRHVIALDGRPNGFSTAGWSVTAQSDGGLDERLAAAFADASGAGPAILVGMDTPQLRAEQLRSFDPSRYDACLGLSTDGGYWAVGFADPVRAIACIPGVPMSTTTTGSVQLARLVTAGLSVQLLDPLTDVDTASTARLVARAAPQTRFARLLERLDVPADDADGLPAGAPELAGVPR